MSLNQQLLDLWCRFLLINEGNKLLVKKKEKKKLTGSRMGQTKCGAALSHEPSPQLQRRAAGSR